MSDPFTTPYATAYDALYRDKDYEGECELLLDVLCNENGTQPSRILDLGAGTGSHAVLLAQRGVQVVGIDQSEAMIEIARTKASQLADDRQPEFVTADIRKARLERKFDAVIMMFAVLGYQHTNDAVLEALTTARAHLESGGLLAFDVWYGPAVLSQRPSDRIQVVESDSRKVIRVASGRLDTRRHLCTVDYRLWALEAGRLLEEITERHVMRYFFPRELELLLDLAGFSLTRIGGFPDFAREPTAATWNVFVLASAL